MKHDWWIEVQQLIPPIGGIYKYFSIAEIYEIGKGKINHNLGEVHGKTKEEAEKKMREKVEKWLKENN
ncbi:MAG: hypothetical protein Q7R95_00895 [bacterium]|nr:hypothetical protein [bacterium]